MEPGTQEAMGSGDSIGGDMQALAQGREGGAGVEGDKQNAADDIGGNNTVPIMAGLRDNNVMHGKLDYGFDSYYAPRRQLTIDADDVGDVIDDQGYHAQLVFDALTMDPAQTSTTQGDMTVKFVKVLNKFNATEDAEAILTDISAMIVKAVIHLHVEGDHLYRHQFLALKPKNDDFKMSATERLSAICNILRDNKKIATDVMSGADKITTFVAAPMGSDGRKVAYKLSNKKRAEAAKNTKDELKALKEAEEAVADAELETRSAEPEELTDEVIEAILQDQQEMKKRKRDGDGDEL